VILLLERYFGVIAGSFMHGQLQNSRLERGQVGQDLKLSFRRPANRLVGKLDPKRRARGTSPRPVDQVILLLERYFGVIAGSFMQLQNSRLERGQVGQDLKLSFRRPANRLVGKLDLWQSAELAVQAPDRLTK
jgi:hypothetical protein